MGTLQIHPVKRALKKIMREKIPTYVFCMGASSTYTKKGQGIQHKTGVSLL